MKINEIITEAPVGFLKGMGNAIRSKLPGGQAAKGKAQLGVAANSIFKAIQQWAGEQGLDMNNMTAEDLKQCTVFPTDKEQGVLDKVIKGLNQPVGPSDPLNSKHIEEIVVSFVREYKKNTLPTATPDPAGPTEIAGAKGRYTFKPGVGWYFKDAKATGMATLIPKGDPRIAQLNQKAQTQTAEL